jgi:hypothetical protein
MDAPLVIDVRTGAVLLLADRIGELVTDIAIRVELAPLVPLLEGRGSKIS